MESVWASGDVLGAYLNKVMKRENDSLHVKVVVPLKLPIPGDKSNEDAGLGSDSRDLS
jgi:hypothetical protein